MQLRKDNNRLRTELSEAMKQFGNLLACVLKKHAYAP